MGKPRKLARPGPHCRDLPPAPLPPARFLPRPCFLEQVRRERLRTDRTRSALSLILLPLQPDLAASPEGLVRAVAAVGGLIRETDHVGLYDRHTLGLILPDTGRMGCHALVDKLRGAAGQLFAAPLFSTYPSQMFESLGREPAPGAGPDPAILAEGVHTPGQWAAKRALDIAGALVGIIVFSPLMALIATAIRLTSPGPALFRQVRLGRNGTPFVLYKFRSMHSGVDDRIHRQFMADLIEGRHEAVNQGHPGQPLYKIKADPRVTPVGRVIRRTSMDELPQFFNVLKGEMSLVGPRPCLAYEAENYEPWQLRRLLGVKPGITGLWQVYGRSRTGFADMVRLDIHYTRVWSPALDLRILLKTVLAVLHGRGAA
jgi:lipopolysaccharide/colanic/teichoic acid biosynthesis glycosyltransferase